MPQKLNIPNLGTLLMLSEDWTFKLYFEERNKTMLQGLGGKRPNGRSWWWLHSEDDIEFPEGVTVEYERAMSEEELANAYQSYRATNRRDNPFVRVTLPKGTQLKVDRIYIRRGAESFNSVTFRTTKICPDKRFANKRFWVKLRDANEIVADIIG